MRAVGKSGLHVPDYAGACISNVVPAIQGRTAVAWLPDVAANASQVVLLVLDGVGWNQLQERRDVAPMLTSMAGGPITSVAPTTTATALSSIITGTPPAEHGVVGYRVRVAGDRVLNILRWRTADGDARESVPPAGFQSLSAFGGAEVPVVTKAEFATTGFTSALGVRRMVGWYVSSSIAVEVGALLRAGEPLVYAYYDGVDRIAHARGFGAHYDAELAQADRLVADVVSVLPPGAALVVTSDHGQVDVGESALPLDDGVLADVALVSGEGRFVWLHAGEGRVDALVERCRSLYEAPGLALVRTRDEIVGDGWYGGALSDEVASRLGDVALVARQRIAFLDPGDPGAAALRCRHGSLTADELLVPLVAVGSPA